MRVAESGGEQLLFEGGINKLISNDLVVVHLQSGSFSIIPD